MPTAAPDLEAQLANIQLLILNLYREVQAIPAPTDAAALQAMYTSLLAIQGRWLNVGPT